MSRAARALLVCVIFVGFALAAGSLTLRRETQAQPGPPVWVDIGQVTINAPQTGSWVKVFVKPSALSNASVGTTELRVGLANGTNWSGWEDYDDVKGVSIAIQAGAGAALVAEATNGAGATSSVAIGYVPFPSDAAPPDFDVTSFTAAFSGGTFTLTASVGAISDQSFPCVGQLVSDSGSSSTETIEGNSSNNTLVEVLTLSASSGDRIRFVSP